jgi:hypothetical protein
VLLSFDGLKPLEKDNGRERFMEHGSDGAQRASFACSAPAAAARAAAFTAFTAFTTFTAMCATMSFVHYILSEEKFLRRRGSVNLISH